MGCMSMPRIAVLFLSVLFAGTAQAQERFITLSSTTSTQPELQVCSVNFAELSEQPKT